MKNVILTLIVLLLYFPICFAQSNNTTPAIEKWRLITAEPGFVITFNNDSTTFSKIIPTGSGEKTRIKKSFKISGEGIANINFKAKNYLSKNDTCTFYAIAYKQGSVFMAFSKSFNSPATPGIVDQVSWYEYLPKGIDSLVTGLIVTGSSRLESINAEIDLSQGNRFEGYKSNIGRFSKDTENIDKLATLCKVWGILKYFTPAFL
jgi:hypothetical protein